ncbi:MAG: rod shape-determining protein MreC [Patescibacteria group bacterium]
MIKDNIVRLILLGVVIGLLIFLHYVGVLSPVENLFARGFKYIQSPIYSLSTKIFKTENKSTIAELEEENKNLTNQIQELITENSKLNQRKDDEQKYEKQLEFLEKKDFISIGAKIIGKSSEGHSGIYLINQGKNQNIKEGYPVITENGILVGKVTTVDSDTSKIMLVTNNLSKIGAQVQNQDSSQGVISGQHGLTIKIDLIAKDEKLEKYDIVITSGLEENIPHGLIIGQIEEIENEESDLFQSAIISPLIDYKQQTIVSVIIP